MEEALLLPTLPVQVTLEASIHRPIRSKRLLMQLLHSKLPQQLDDLLSKLGVPSRVKLVVTLADAARVNLLPLTLYVSNHICAYSWDVIQRLYCYVSGAAFHQFISQREITDRLAVWCSEADDDELTRVVELIGSICVEVIKLQPSVLLQSEQLTAYRGQLTAFSNKSEPIELESRPERLPTLEWLAQVLAYILDHKLSIEASAMLPNSETVAALLLDCWEHGMTHVYAAEELMDALVSKGAHVKIYFASDYLREVTDSHDADVDYFYMLRQAIYDEFGTSFPGFKFIEDPTLRPRSFTLMINAHLLKPWVGFGSPPEPSTRQAQLKYMVRVLYDDLRADLNCLFPRWSAVDYVSGWEREFPTLVGMVKARFNPTQCARVLRALLGDQISLRNLRLILERMLDYEGDLDNFDELNVFVRASFPRQ